MTTKLGVWAGLVGIAAVAMLACSSEDDGGGGSGATGGADAGIGGASGSGGVGGTAGSSGQAGAGTGGIPNPPPKPTPADIMYAPVNAIPSGQQLLFSDWAASPNTVSRILDDGTEEQVVFKAFRVWSMGATPDGATIAFACGDPKQKEHYGLELGDAIQHTWLYDAASQNAQVLSYGNLNDECHHFNADASKLYVCRRYDFQLLPGPQYVNKGYQLGRLTVADGSFEFLTPEPQNRFELNPTPLGDESTLLFTQIDIAGGAQARQIMKLEVATDTRTQVVNNATLGGLSPDGQRILYRNHNDGGKLYVADVDGQNPIKITSTAATDGTWSPDGSRVAYLFGETQACSHIEIVKADGSEADSPKRVRNCGSQFITGLAWIDRP